MPRKLLDTVRGFDYPEQPPLGNKKMELKLLLSFLSCFFILGWDKRFPFPSTLLRLLPPFITFTILLITI